MNLIIINSSSVAVLNHICYQLPSQDLKRVRLVCKALDYSAQRALFRLVWLRANIDSFHHLDLISRHPVLRHHVTTIHHSGEMLYEHPNFDRWYERLGGEIDVSWESRRLLRDQFTPEDLNYYYLKYRHHIEGQAYINTGGNAESRLVKALEKLPQIKTIEYASREVKLEELYTGQMPFSAIGRETLSEPCFCGGYKHHTKQFIALLQAASQSCKTVSTIRGIRLRWEIFAGYDQLETMLQAVSHVQHLSLTMSGLDLDGRRQKLARLIASIPDLKKLELCFGRLPWDGTGFVIKLSDLLKFRVYWPILQRLVLQGFKTTENIIKMFLKRHAASLKSLELSDMSFSLRSPSNDETLDLCGGSFLSLIKFLQASLKLEHVKFDGTLCNNWDEGWVVNWKNEYTNDEDCLKSRIEKFIVHGGDCPMQAPDEEDEDDGWEWQGDESWRYDGRLIA